MDLSYYTMPLSLSTENLLAHGIPDLPCYPLPTDVSVNNKFILIMSWKEQLHTFGGWHLHHVEVKKKCAKSAFITTCYVHLRKHVRVDLRMFLQNWEHMLITIISNILKFHNID